MAFPDLKPMWKALEAIKQPIFYFGGFTGLVLLIFGSFQNAGADHDLKCHLMEGGAVAFFLFGLLGSVSYLRGVVANETQATSARELPKVVKDHTANADIKPRTKRAGSNHHKPNPEPPDENLRIA